MAALDRNQLNSSIISKLVLKHVFNNEDSKQTTKVIFNALQVLLNGDNEKYSFEPEDFTNGWIQNLYTDDFQVILSKLNEKTGERKGLGKYYTPKDITRYIVANLFVNSIDRGNYQIFSETDCFNTLLSNNIAIINELLFSRNVFDPTSGAGEFLLSALELKFELLEKTDNIINDKCYLDILSTIWGNDIEISATEITKLRLFFFTISKLENESSISKASEILNARFSCDDFVNPPKSNHIKFSIIVGNPPYVEYSKTPSTPTYNYGNIYADILHNSSLLLTDEGVMGFVIPLSYMATSRMAKIRKMLMKNVPKQFVMSYADRPDCLFASVHQKLTILLAAKGTKKEIYSSGYKHWYKSERKELLNGCSIIRNSFTLPSIPKIGSEIERSIFEKLFASNNETTIYEMLNNGNAPNIYLNMRGTFWIKAFSISPGSSEYKAFCADPVLKPYILALLNSSIFFFFWIVTSDCWHITRKELQLFNVVKENIDTNHFTLLTDSLEKKLEDTKEYIGTKQVEYAYKHKACKAEIDAIDDALQNLYCLTDEELQYLKHFALKYRMSSGK